MKTTPMVILSLMVCLGREVASAYGDQIVAWRWRNDDGSVHAATWRDSVNTPVILGTGANIRLRLEDMVPYGGTGRMTLHYTEDPFAGTWFPVTSTDTGKFVISPSEYLSDTVSYAGNQLLPPTSPSNVYRRTITIDSSTGFVLTTEEASIYELEYSIMSTNHIAPASAYFFTTFRDSVLMDGNEYAVLLTPPVHWTSRSVGKWCYFNGVACVDALTAFAAGNGNGRGLIFRTVDGGRSWIDMPVPPCENMSAIAFADPDIGVAVGYPGVIMRTSDGGQTWAVVKAFGSGRTLAAVAFADRDSGAIAGYYDSGSGVVRGLLWRTTDAGENWTEIQGPSGVRLYSVAFASVEIGTAVGEGGRMMRTTDGGRSWTSVSSGVMTDLRGVSYGDGNKGAAVGGGWGPGEGVILSTSDGGSTWRQRPVKGVTGLFGVSLVDASHGWTVGAGGWTAKTTDGGVTWQRLASGAYRTLSAVDFVDRDNGLAVGEAGGVFATTDGGATSAVQPWAEGLPTDVVLRQNYPNPFNPRTKIQFTIVNRQWTIVTVFDVLGQEVATLVNEEKQPGTHTVEFDGSGFASGVYLYRLITGDVVQTRKMVIVK